MPMTFADVVQFLKGLNAPEEIILAVETELTSRLQGTYEAMVEKLKDDPELTQQYFGTPEAIVESKAVIEDELANRAMDAITDILINS